VARKALIRHNMKEAGENITCRCKNSKCLKWVCRSCLIVCWLWILAHSCQLHVVIHRLYCDCFRSGKVGTSDNLSSILLPDSITNISTILLCSFHRFNLSTGMQDQRVWLHRMQKHRCQQRSDGNPHKDYHGDSP
jgi:hypothetical protein